ncbi:MAG: response regulator [Puniceicoccaceae bacterium 5H]|nr:MAG: response regulator [Puniceicoccaceae bacterium 5H]
MRVLIVEDASRLREGIARALRKAGFVVDTASDGEQGLWAAESHPYDAVVLDIMLPRLSGLDLLTRLRQQGSALPILLLTAKDTVADRVQGLRSGADDYLIKPFALDELLARVEVLCRRSYGATTTRIQVGEMEIDTSAHRVFMRGRELTLPAREFALLEYLARRRGEVVTRSEIEAHIYDDQADPMSNVVDAAIYSLRKKLAAAGVPSLIQTRRGRGYILELPEESQK